MCYTRRNLKPSLTALLLINCLAVPLKADRPFCPTLLLRENSGVYTGKYGIELELAPLRLMALLDTIDGTLAPLLQGKRPPRWLLETFGLSRPANNQELEGALATRWDALSLRGQARLLNFVCHLRPAADYLKCREFAGLVTRDMVTHHFATRRHYRGRDFEPGAYLVSMDGFLERRVEATSLLNAHTGKEFEIKFRRDEGALEPFWEDVGIVAGTQGLSPVSLHFHHLQRIDYDRFARFGSLQVARLIDAFIRLEHFAQMTSVLEGGSIEATVEETYGSHTMSLFGPLDSKSIEQAIYNLLDWLRLPFEKAHVELKGYMGLHWAGKFEDRGLFSIQDRSQSANSLGKKVPPFVLATNRMLSDPYFGLNEETMVYWLEVFKTKRFMREDIDNLFSALSLLSPLELLNQMSLAVKMMVGGSPGLMDLLVHGRLSSKHRLLFYDWNQHYLMRLDNLDLDRLLERIREAQIKYLGIVAEFANGLRERPHEANMWVHDPVERFLDGAVESFLQESGLMGLASESEKYFGETLALSYYNQNWKDLWLLVDDDGSEVIEVASEYRQPLEVAAIQAQEIKMLLHPWEMVPVVMGTRSQEVLNRIRAVRKKYLPQLFPLAVAFAKGELGIEPLRRALQPILAGFLKESGIYDIHAESIGLSVHWP